MFRIIKYLLYIILFILLLTIFIGLYIYLRNKYDNFYFERKFSDKSYITYKNPLDKTYVLSDWQSIIKSEIPFNKIVTPGTHDSLTYNWESSYSLIQQYTAYWAETQYLNVEKQLLAGVRYFDARVGLKDNKVVTYHGDFSSNTTYESSVNELIDFTNKHPNEIIVWKLIILNNQDAVKKIIDEKQYHSRLNFIPWTSNYFKSTLGELRNMRSDKNKAGVIFVSEYYNSTDSYVWPVSKIKDPYDFNALMNDKKSFKITMDKIYSDKEFPDDSLTVLQMIAEYQSTVKTSLLKSVESISKKINKTLDDNDLPLPPKNGYNVIMIDYLVPSNSSMIINHNPKNYFL